VLPFSLGEELFAAANEPKTFVAYPGGCHEPLFIANPADYAARLREFLRLKPKEAEEAEQGQEAKDNVR
jgi:fermentation-respiration switch protein FrsA (DUF1100 family)